MVPYINELWMLRARPMALTWFIVLTYIQVEYSLLLQEEPLTQFQKSSYTLEVPKVVVAVTSNRL